MKYNNTLHYQIQAQNPDSMEKLHDSRTAWREERMRANRLVKLYHLAGYEDYADRVEVCSTWLEYRVVGDQRTLASANFCRLRLCPICTARGAVQRAKLLSQVMDAVQREHKCQYIFLTLTVANVSGDKLGDAIGQLTRAWDKMMRHRPIARAVKGWFRAIEITRQSVLGTYHPHIHALIAVEDDYFARSSGLYLSHAAWLQHWQQALGVDYKPSVRISKTTDAKDGKGAVLEAAKYVTKDSDYIDDRLSDQDAAQIVADYTRALYHRRLTAFGGWLKEAAQRLQADDLEHVELQPGDDETIRADLAEVIEQYGWHFGAGDYVLARRFINPLRIKREGGDNDA